MCRRNLLLGGILAAFGAGLVLGLLISSGFFKTLLGIAAIAFGVFLIVK